MKYIMRGTSNLVCKLFALHQMILCDFYVLIEFDLRRVSHVLSSGSGGHANTSLPLKYRNIRLCSAVVLSRTRNREFAVRRDPDAVAVH